MALKYLLPCPCGREVIVEPRQAGESLHCECGSTLQVPTLLAMTSLDAAPEEPVAETPTAAWGGPQRVVLLGAAVTAAALAAGAWLFITRPVSRFAFDPAQVAWSARTMPPATTWENWEMVKQGLDRRIDREYEHLTGLFYIQEGIAGIVGCVGLVLILLGAVWKGMARKTAPPTRFPPLPTGH